MREKRTRLISEILDYKKIIEDKANSLTKTEYHSIKKFIGVGREALSQHGLKKKKSKNSTWIDYLALCTENFSLYPVQLKLYFGFIPRMDYNRRPPPGMTEYEMSEAYFLKSAEEYKGYQYNLKDLSGEELAKIFGKMKKVEKMINYIIKNRTTSGKEDK